MGETSKEHWERMKRWAEEDAAERAAGRGMPPERRPRIITSPLTAEERSKQQEWELLFGTRPAAKRTIRIRDPHPEHEVPPVSPIWFDDLKMYAIRPDDLPQAWSLGRSIARVRERLVRKKWCSPCGGSAGTYRASNGDSIRVDLSIRPPTLTDTLAAFYITPCS